MIFLSTLSLRRATHWPGVPVVGRPISIHALLAESDMPWSAWLASRVNFYPRSPCGERHNVRLDTRQRDAISIHALLAESDKNTTRQIKQACHFYPRSPCGERPKWASSAKKSPVFLSTLSLRRATRTGLTCGGGKIISIHALLAESDIILIALSIQPTKFLSTLSLRRATNSAYGALDGASISIHALLAESDS